MATAQSKPPRKPVADAKKASASAPQPKTARQPPAGKKKKVPSAPSAKPDPIAAGKVKLVRDSFTIPDSEYDRLKQLKQRSAGLGRPAKKSELLRAGIFALRAMDDVGLINALGIVPTLKTGRPKAKKNETKPGRRPTA